MNHKKAVLITGASSGIGKYLTELLASRGWTVWAGYRNEKVKRELIHINPRNIFPIKLDVIDGRSIIRAKKKIEESKTPLYALINNAGIAIGGPIEFIDLREIKKLYDVNFFGNIKITQIFLPILRKNKGRIINIGSIAGLVSIPFMMPYCSSKYAIEALSDSLRRELIGHGVRVSLIEPGVINTDIWSKSFAWFDKFEKNKPMNSYQPYLDNSFKILENYQEYAISMEKIKKPIIHALESENPKPRYLVCNHSLLLRFLLKVMPARIVDFLCAMIQSH